ncbi:MAG: hypothetical protein JXL80_07705 [Planctomycetes bacterium]|nr:hypothetical protein [Planctomycetota bacterium]
MITFRCSNCKAEIEVPDHYAGRVAQCPTCSRRLRVPQPSADRTSSRRVSAPLDTSSTSSIVSLDGQIYQIQPQIEGMMIAAAAVIAASLPVMLLVGLKLRAYSPWLWGGLIATGVVVFGMLLVVPGYSNIRRSRGRKSGRRLGMMAIAGGLTLVATYLSVGLITYAVADHSSCRSRLTAVHRALMQYASRNQGYLPPRPETLVEQGYLRAAKLTCPQHGHVREGDPTYIPESYNPRIDLRTEGDEFPGDTIILIDATKHRSQGVLDSETGKPEPYYYALRLKPDAKGEVVGYVPYKYVIERINDQRKVISRVEANRRSYQSGNTETPSPQDDGAAPQPGR